MNITDELFALRDEQYRQFHSKLIPSVAPELIIGIRTPVLRKFAKEFSKTDDAKRFTDKLPHKYYEENNLHAFLLEQIKDFDILLEQTEKFLPYIDNWATCDMFRPKLFKNHTDLLMPKIISWINSENTYTVRFAIGMLLSYYLDDDNFKNEHLKLAASIKSDEYYINMMTAWYFATALAKQYQHTLPYIADNRLDIWIHNKTIQKAAESRRIDADTKKYLKTLKRK